MPKLLTAPVTLNNLWRPLFSDISRNNLSTESLQGKSLNLRNMITQHTKNFRQYFLFCYFSKCEILRKVHSCRWSLPHLITFDAFGSLIYWRQIYPVYEENLWSTESLGGKCKLWIYNFSSHKKEWATFN